MSTRLLAPFAASVLVLTLASCGERATVAEEQPPAASSTAQTTRCTYTSGGTASRDVDVPGSEAVAEGEIPVTLATSIGDLELSLDAGAAPCTVNSFTSLAEQGFFDGTRCHRLTTRGIFVLQCGDPDATGAGGPGYQFDDELTGEETYPAGTLAMANSGPDTNGSQFFVVYRKTRLPALYTVFGTVDDATVQAVQQVADAGTDNAYGDGDGAPLTEVSIDAATVGSG